MGEILSDSQLQAILSPKGHRAMSGDIPRHNVGGRRALARNG